MTPSDDLPSETAFNSPEADETRPILMGMPPAWQRVYDHLREAQAVAVMGSQDKPGDLEAKSVLRASVAAVKAFRQVYLEVSTASLIHQIDKPNQH